MIFSSHVHAQSLAQRLYQTHTYFREKALSERRFKHTDILPLLDSVAKSQGFKVSVIGYSVQQRSINQVVWGKGKTKVLLWSQMHGNEPTATMALFDIFRFLAEKNDGFDDFRQLLSQKLTLYFVPMLNPDGAEVFKRRNAFDIDLNRDALRLQSPEARLLKQLQQSIFPAFGFNLHDQSARYSVGQTPNLATISFLATAYNHECSINAVRKRSMQLIVQMNRTLQAFIPNQVARYSDEHEPRAFGDNIQKWGTSLVLIESGGYANDPEKQVIRQLNYVAILSGLEAIATKQYIQESITDYHHIPQNANAIFDLIIRNVQIQSNGQLVTVDLGINRNESPAQLPRRFNVRSSIDEIGDMSVFFGTKELDATGLVVAEIENIAINAKADFVLKRGDTIVYTVKNGLLE